MNEETFASLVDRACADVEPAPPPVDLIMRSGRRRRWLGATATIAGAAAVVGAVVVGGALLSEQHLARPPAQATQSATPPATAMTPPAGARLVGANGIVVAVPEQWGTDQVGCDNQTPVRPTVSFDRHGGPACGVILRDQVPSLRVDTGEHADVTAADGQPAGTVDGVPVRRGPTTTDRYGFVTSWIAFPDEQVRFIVTEATIEDVERVLGSARLVTDGYRLVPSSPSSYLGSASPSRLDYMTERVRDVGLSPVVVEEPHGWQRPGAFLRTVPAIGTPVADGASVTVVYAAGDLDYYATARSLGAGGWAFAPATDFTPPVSREEAKQLVGAVDFNTDAFLRTQVCPPGADCADPLPRQVWLVIDEFHYNGSGNTSHLVVIDAKSGQQVAEGTFEGTS